MLEMSGTSQCGDLCHDVTLELQIRPKPKKAASRLNAQGEYTAFLYFDLLVGTRERVGVSSSPFGGRLDGFLSPGGMEFSGSAYSRMNPAFLVRSRGGSVRRGQRRSGPHDRRYAQGLQ